jgi:hypothetical protein
MLAFAWACGGDDSTTTDGGNDAQNGNDATNGNDTGNGSDTGNGNETGTDSGPQPAKANYGFVSFSESKNQNTSTYTASAAFYATPDSGVTTPPSGCTTTVGSCCYKAPPDAGTTGSNPTPVSAGGITLKDGATTIGTMSPTGTTYTALNSGTTNTLKWTDGDSITVSAAGDTVHPFSGSVATVTLFAGVSPALSFVPGTTISKSQNFTISWTAGTGATSLLLSEGNIVGGTISCTATTDPGTFTIDKSLLASLTSLTGTITLSRTNEADASPDNATITLESTTSTSGSTTFTN